MPTSDQSKAFWHGVTPYHALVFVGCWLGGIFDGMDSNLFSVMLPNAIQALTHTANKAVVSTMGAYITSIFLLGWTLGGLAFGFVGDRFGRVKAMVFSILLYALFTGLAGLSQNIWQLGLCRFLTGIGIGGELVCITTLLAETWPERSRAFATGMLITGYQVGVFISGLVASVLSSWRVVFLVGALPALLTIFIRLKLEEPERWTAQQQQTALQEQGVSLFSAENRRNLLVGGLAFGSLLIGYWASLVWIPTWIQDLVGPNTLLGHSSGNEKSTATMYHGVAAVLGCLSAGWLADSIGRRWTMIVSFLGCFGASALLFLSNTHFSPAIYWQDALLGYFIGINQACSYVYFSELFVTRIRASAIGFCLNVGRVSAAVAVLFMGPLVAFFGGYAQAAMAFSIPYLLGTFAMLAGPETRGQALRD